MYGQAPPGYPPAGYGSAGANGGSSRVEHAGHPGLVGLTAQQTAESQRSQVGYQQLQSVADESARYQQLQSAAHVQYVAAQQQYGQYAQAQQNAAFIGLPAITR